MTQVSKEKALELLKDKALQIKTVDEIYEIFKKDEEVVGAIAMNLSLRTSVYERAKEKSNTMTTLLTKIATSSDMGSRWAVAKNPHCPREILEMLSHDSVNLVRALVATNPNTPSTILSHLFSDEKIVRDGLSGNPSTPLKYLKTLSKDSDKMVRLRIAENPSSTHEILKKLTNDADTDVAKAAKSKLGLL